MRTIRYLVAIVAVTILLAATMGRADDNKKYTIAVIPKGTTHEYWKSMHAGAIKAAQELGCQIIWKGPLKEDDREDQIKVVEDFITRGVSGIVLAPLDDTALREPVAEAKNNGIPTVIIDSGLKSEDYVSFVATDNRKGGHMAGVELARLLGGHGKVAMLRYAQGSASTTDREDGFLDAMKENPGLDIVSDNQYGGATTETAYAASEDLLARFKNADGTLAIDGIFACNESTAFGMLRALQDGGYAGKVKFVGFDSSQKLLDAIQAGQMNASVVQNPFKMGYLAVKTMVADLNGQKVEKRIDTGAYLVTKDNMETPDIKEVIHPPLDQYLNGK
ncbi:MAG TPA: substrate-binding domain-containing protein [Tepidisphaeraceae bacterium]|jgi:ribose transport system substrate-binding protein